MADPEKITINMNVVDLGKVDLLVEEGFYTNRTDFIRTAIRNQLTRHEDEVSLSIGRRREQFVEPVRCQRKSARPARSR